MSNSNSNYIYFFLLLLIAIAYLWSRWRPCSWTPSSCSCGASWAPRSSSCSWRSSRARARSSTWAGWRRSLLEALKWTRWVPRTLRSWRSPWGNKVPGNSSRCAWSNSSTKGSRAATRWVSRQASRWISRAATRWISRAATRWISRQASR